MKKVRLIVFILSIILLTTLIPQGHIQASQILYLDYKVRSADTLWLLSNRFGTTITAIKDASRYWSNNLYIGQKLVISVSKDNPEIYVVKAGDTLWKISRQYGTTVANLKELNALTSDYLYIGQVLLVPKSRSLPPQPKKPEIPGLRLQLTSEQIELLAKVVQGEAGGEIYEGQVAVAAVVINRVKDERFPNTLEGVIYEPWAFEAVMNGWFNQSPRQQVYNATLDALRGWDPTGGALFFYNPDLTSHPWMLSRPIIKRIGAHVFTK